MKRIWKDIPGYEGLYQISTKAEIRKLLTDGTYRYLKPSYKKNRKCNTYIVKLAKNGKRTEKTLIGLMALSFLGPVPEGYMPHHKNGMKSDNNLENIEYISRKENGKKYGSKGNRIPVAKIDQMGNIIEFYPSAREAARQNNLVCSTIIERCNGHRKSIFAPDGFAYAWDNKLSINNVLKKIKSTIQ